MTLDEYRIRTNKMQAKIQFTYTLNDDLINELMGLMEYELDHLADEAEKKALQIMIDTLDLITSSPDILRFSTHEMLRMVQHHYSNGARYHTLMPTRTHLNVHQDLSMHRIYTRIKKASSEMKEIMNVQRTINEKQRMMQEIDSDMKSLRGVDISAVRIENKSNKNRILKMMDKKETLHYDIQYFQLWIDEFKSSNKLIRKFLSKLDTDDRSLIKDNNFEEAKPIIIKHMDEFLSICG